METASCICSGGRIFFGYGNLFLKGELADETGSCSLFHIKKS